jgi:hypothetical protein
MTTEGNNTGLSEREHQRIVKLMAKHKVALDECSRQLAMNYNAPAQRIITACCNETGISRLDYEKINAVEGNCRYEAPPRRLLDRWARY